MQRLPVGSSRRSARPRRLGSVRGVGLRPAIDIAPGWDRGRVSAWLMASIVAIGLIWRLARLVSGYPIWYDEAFLAVTWMTRDVPGLFRPLEYYQVAPIGFLLLEKGMTVAFGPSPLSLRLVPFLAGAASLVLFARFARRSLDRTSALLAVGIFAASYYPARHGAEVKPYAIDLLLALVTIDLGWSLRVDRGPARRWVMLTAVVAVGAWFSYPLAFVAGGVGLVLAIGAWESRDRKAALALLGMAAVSTASWLAMYVLVARSQAASTSFYARSATWKGAFPPWDQPWRLPGWLLDVHTGNMLAYPNGGNNYGSLASTILVAVGCYRLRRQHRWALALLLLSPLPPTFLASVAGRYPYGTSARTMLFMAPSFCLLAGAGTAGVIRRFFPARRRLRATAFAILGLAVAILVTTVANIAAPWREVGDVENRRVVRELASATRAGDLWVGYDGIASLSGGDDLMIQHWVGQAAEIRYNVLAQAPVPVRWMPDRLDDLATSGRTWLIVHRSGFPRFDEGRLLELRADLGRRLGEPVNHRWQLTPMVSVEACEYPPAPTRSNPESPVTAP